MCSLAAVCDLVPARAHAALDKLGLRDVPVYESLPEMLRKEKPDVVHICTPSGAHLDCAMESIKAGVNVICEKPLEVTLARCDQMLEAADKANVRIGGIFQYRWNEANAAIRGAVEQGRFGRSRLGGLIHSLVAAGRIFRNRRLARHVEDGRRRGDHESVDPRDRSDPLVRRADQNRLRLLRPARSRQDRSRRHTLSDAPICQAALSERSWARPRCIPAHPVRVEIGGENGTAVSEDGLKVFKFREPRPEDAELIAKFGQLVSVTREALSNKDAIERAAEAKTKLHRQNIESILSAWQENREADTSGAEARKAVAITTALYESARKNGAPVDVK